MVKQTQEQSFLDKVTERSGLSSTTDAQRASNVMFRILRDMMSNKTTNQIEADLKEQASEPEQDVVGLWKDYNVMVAFFSRISPAQNLHLKPGTFMLRFKEEGALPEGLDPKVVAKAIFSATKEILSPDRSQDVAAALPGEIRQLWEQA